MTKPMNPAPKVLYRFVVDKPVHDVIRDLKVEGWPLIAEGTDRAVFSWWGRPEQRAGKSSEN